MFALGAAEAAALGARAMLDELGRRGQEDAERTWTAEQIRAITDAALARYIADASS
jgi:hypothetical protein